MSMCKMNHVNAERGKVLYDLVYTDRSTLPELLKPATPEPTFEEQRQF